MGAAFAVVTPLPDGLRDCEGILAPTFCRGGWLPESHTLLLKAAPQVAFGNMEDQLGFFI